MRRIFVVNAKAGHGEAARIRSWIRDEFLEGDAEIGYPDSRDTGSAPCASRAWFRLPRGVAETEAIVIAVGGDGTVNRVLNAVAGRNVPIGILPCGRANDFARAVGIPCRLRAAWRILRNPAFRDVDLVSVNGARFGSTGGLGLVASISDRANRWRRGKGIVGNVIGGLGPLGYPLATGMVICRGWDPVEARIETGGSCVSGRFAAIIVSKQPRFGGWFRSAPEASGDDGLIHLCAIASPPSRGRMLHIAGEILVGRPGVCKEIVRIAAPSLTITTAAEVLFYADGEAMRSGRIFRLDVLPRAVRVAVPRTAVPASGSRLPVIPSRLRCREEERRWTRAS